jgi:AcrR family transcriptional regulator
LWKIAGPAGRNGAFVSSAFVCGRFSFYNRPQRGRDAEETTPPFLARSFRTIEDAHAAHPEPRRASRRCGCRHPRARPLMARRPIGSGGTKARLLDAAEALFIEHGYEAMSLRQITLLAGANPAAVNYHFGSKEVLMQELLSKHLDRLNEERLQLLSLCESHYGEAAMDVTVVLSALFVPALRLSKDKAAGGPAFIRLLGRIYSDPSPFVRNFLYEHYQFIFERFFAAFSRALPDMPRAELGVRLQFGLKALSGMLASENMDELVAAICVGRTPDDALMLTRLIAFIAPVLTTAFDRGEHVAAIARMMDLADAAASAVDARALAATARKPARHGPWMGGIAK